MEHADAGVLSAAYLQGQATGRLAGGPVTRFPLRRGRPGTSGARRTGRPPVPAGVRADPVPVGSTIRSGQQAALGSDLIALVDALRLDRPTR